MKRLALVAALLTLSLTACGEKPKAPVVAVSYTHLTLPTICSV